MGRILVKPGVDFGPCLAPAGARILEVLRKFVRGVQFDLTITSARDGLHSGPADPHHTGEAFDVRTHDLTASEKQQVVFYMQGMLGPQFYAFVEDPDGANEHIHVQRRKGTTYSVQDLLNS
jgi:hypothetical protein